MFNHRMILNLIKYIPLNFIIINDKFLFQNLDGIQLFRGLCLSKHDFAKIAFTKDGEEVEMVEAYSPTRPSL